MKKVPKNFN